GAAVLEPRAVERALEPRDRLRVGVGERRGLRVRRVRRRRADRRYRKAVLGEGEPYDQASHGENAEQRQRQDPPGAPYRARGWVSHRSGARLVSLGRSE